MRIFKILPALAALSVISACASILDGPTQNVTLETPGATEAECMLNNGVKYRAVTGERLRIMRSHRDLTVDCYASGDRHKQIVIEAAFNPWGATNVSNGAAPGGTYDHFSGALYLYPDVISVDFIGMPTRGFETPAYHNKDAPNPYKQPIENYGSSSARIPSDSEYLRRGVERRTTNFNANPFSTDNGSAASGGMGGGAVTPMPGEASVPSMTPSRPAGSTAEELTRSANPTVFNN